MTESASDRTLDTTWQVVFYLVRNDLPTVTNADVARAIGVSRSAVSRAVDALVAGKVLERTPSGGFELSLFFAEAYARRLRFWQKRHGMMRLAIQAMGAEIALLAGDQSDNQPFNRKPQARANEGKEGS